MTFTITLQLRFVLIDTISFNNVVDIQLIIAYLAQVEHGAQGKSKKQYEKKYLFQNEIFGKDNSLILIILKKSHKKGHQLVAFFFMLLNKLNIDLVLGFAVQVNR